MIAGVAAPPRFAMGRAPHKRQRNVTMPSIETLRIKLFCDGADLGHIAAMAKNPLIRGFTTNPSLMRQAGIVDYAGFGREVLATVGGRPVSFEVFADDFAGMERQARLIAGWGGNVYVKIPVTNTAREFSGPLIRRLSADGVPLNVTAILTLDQVEMVAAALDPRAPAIVSVFAGRIADTGVDPVPFMHEALHLLRRRPHAELLWASPRELLNIFQADAIGVPIITATPDILSKLPLVGRDLAEYSLATVKMFYDAAQTAGYSL
jgi:transaldolase